jgi:hypothetical protein
MERVPSKLEFSDKNVFGRITSDTFCRAELCADNMLGLAP